MTDLAPLTHRATCPDCSEHLVAVPSGWLCPEGHGKILSAYQAAALHANQRPVAHRIDGLSAPKLWSIEGHPGLYMRAGKWGDVLAATGGKVWRFTRMRQLEERLKLALGDQT